MLPVPAKSSETRAILLLISGRIEPLWIENENVFVKAGKISKMSLSIGLLRSTAPCYNELAKSGFGI
jgi:hypothetical protein